MYYTKLTKKGEGFRSSFLLFFILSTILNYQQVKAEMLLPTAYDFDIGGVPILREDTIPYAEGDTISIFTSGLDTIYLTYIPDIDSNSVNAWMIANPNKQMVIEMHKQNAPVNMGLIGVNLTDFFEPLKAHEDENPNYQETPSPWDALVDLAPKTIRVFSGASAKFMHPLGSYDPIEDIYYGGYGYNWKEMISYFDMTFAGENAPTVGASYDYTTIESQLSGGCATGCNTWIDDKLMYRFVEFYDKCLDQPTYDPTDPDFDTKAEQPLYINQLLRLIDRIETNNVGHTVDLIYCVNIESMTASEMIEVIDYIELDNTIYCTGRLN